MYFETKNFEFFGHFLTLNNFFVFQPIVMILFFYLFLTVSSNVLSMKSTLAKKITRNNLWLYFGIFLFILFVSFFSHVI